MRASAEAIDGLLGQIYEAALQPALWQGVLADFGELLGGAALVASTLHRTEGVKLAVAKGVDPAAFKVVTERFNGPQTNPLVAAMPRLPVATPVAIESLQPELDYLSSGLYNEVFRPQGLAHRAIACVHRTDDVTCPVGILRPTRAGQFSEEKTRLLKLVLPHIGRAMRLSLRLNTLERNLQLTRDALDLCPYGVLIVDGRGRVAHANRAANRMLGLNDGLRVKRGEAGAWQHADGLALRKAVHEAIHSPSGGTSAVTIHRRGGARGYMALVAPLGPRSPADLAGGEPGALVLVNDPAVAPSPSRESLRQMFSLTPKEAELAIAMLAGRRLKEYAGERGISVNTARSQLQSLFSKTGTARQADLIQLLQGLPRLT